MKIPINKYAVYTHSLAGEVFYVGVGKGTRPFDQLFRNSVWKRITQKSGFFDVYISGWYESREEAIKRESYLIRALRPLANIQIGKSKNLTDKKWGEHDYSAQFRCADLFVDNVFDKLGIDKHSLNGTARGSQIVGASVAHNTPDLQSVQTA